MNSLNVKEIEAILPHRHPFLLVDAIEDYEPGKYAVGYKCVTFREDFFQGHFPEEPGDAGRPDCGGPGPDRSGGDPLQAGKSGENRLFWRIEKCRFKRKVRPGDKIRLETRIIREKGPLGIGEAIATVDGELAVKAELTFMVG